MNIDALSRKERLLGAALELQKRAESRSLRRVFDFTANIVATNWIAFIDGEILKEFSQQTVQQLASLLRRERELPFKRTNIPNSKSEH